MNFKNLLYWRRPLWIAENATFCQNVFTDPGLKLNIWAIKAK